MLSQKEKSRYLIKMSNLENKILNLEKEINESFEQSSLYFDLGLPITTEMKNNTDKLGAELNKAVTDFRYYNMLIEESEDFSFMSN